MPLSVFLPEFITLSVASVVILFVFLIKFVILIVADVTLFVFLIEFVINVANVVVLFLSDIVVLVVCVWWLSYCGQCCRFFPVWHCCSSCLCVVTLIVANVVIFFLSDIVVLLLCVRWHSRTVPERRRNQWTVMMMPGDEASERTVPGATAGATMRSEWRFYPVVTSWRGGIGCTQLWCHWRGGIGWCGAFSGLYIYIYRLVWCLLWPVYIYI